MKKRYHGPQLNRDWVGLRVKLRRRVRNAYGSLPEGATGVIDGYSRLGIRFESDSCKKCGLQLSISQMRREDFDILTPPEEWPDTRGNPPKRYRRGYW